jgi:hypothetical protein
MVYQACSGTEETGAPPPAITCPPDHLPTTALGKLNAASRLHTDTETWCACVSQQLRVLQQDSTLYLASPSPPTHPPPPHPPLPTPPTPPRPTPATTQGGEAHNHCQGSLWRPKHVIIVCCCRVVPEKTAYVVERYACDTCGRASQQTVEASSSSNSTVATQTFACRTHVPAFLQNNCLQALSCPMQARQQPHAPLAALLF